MATAKEIKKETDIPNGARFYKCALQINPYDYLKRHGKRTNFTNEENYNKAIVNACIENGVEVISITDHYRVQTTEKLSKEAIAAGIYVFKGFEAVTKDGVHVLCLFEQQKTQLELERILGDCGIHDQSEISPTGKYDVTEFLDQATDVWQGVCIAAHVASTDGLLKKLNGQSTINHWKNPKLISCSLPGPVINAPEGIRQILENTNPEYRRERKIAVINAQDINSPEDLQKPSSTCFIKMSVISSEGLRQAFLDPGSRIRLSSDPVPENHEEFLTLAWEGGFLDDSAVHFNENLNVLIGGRGTGKSTIIESIRYVLGKEPLGDEARRIHDGIIKNVLKSGTKISLHLLSHYPSKKEYIIERTVPNQPVIRDEMGTILELNPYYLLPEIEIYGQHEISELTRNKEKLTKLLDRHIEKNPRNELEFDDVVRDLEKKRIEIVGLKNKIDQNSDKLASLPGLEETFRRYKAAGLDSKLLKNTLLIREEVILSDAAQKLENLKKSLSGIHMIAEANKINIDQKELEKLPNSKIIMEVKNSLDSLSDTIETKIKGLEVNVLATEETYKHAFDKWKKQKELNQKEFDKIMRELQSKKIDGTEFVRLQKKLRN